MAIESNPSTGAPRRAYFDRLEGYEPSTSWTKPQEDREPRWAVQRARYSFDDRQTWSLDTAMVELLYERLQMFLQFADENIDLEHHKFLFEGVIYTQREAIQELIELSEAVLSDSDISGVERPAAKLWGLWAVVHPAMWW